MEVIVIESKSSTKLRDKTSENAPRIAPEAVLISDPKDAFALCKAASDRLWEYRPTQLVLAVLLTGTALTGPAMASCTTSPDGFTKTCTGDITQQEQFNRFNVTENETSPYNFVISGLTSTSATSTVPAGGQESIVFSMFGTVFDGAKDGNQNGINAPDLSFSLNLDGQASDFGVISENFNAIELSSEGTFGTQGGKSEGDGRQTGKTGHSGGSGGAITVDINDSDVQAKTTTLYVQTYGDSGGNGGEGRSNSEGDGIGGNGGVGGSGGPITLNITDTDLQARRNALFVQSFGDIGGIGGEGRSVSEGDGRGGIGGDGGVGGAISINLNNVSASNSVSQPTFDISNFGGTAGMGGLGETDTTSKTATGGTGGTGGLGNEVTLTVTNGLTVTSMGTGVLMTSTGGLGGEGGEGNLTQDKGTVNSGSGGNGGQGGAITFQSSTDSEQIEIDATNGPAVRLVSNGGQGGNGGRDQLPGAGDPLLSVGGTGGAGGAVTFSVASNDVILKTTGQGNTALLAESLGGAGGDAGTITGTSGAGASGEGGDAGTVDVLLGTGSTSITSTNGEGLFAQSFGGAVVNTLSQTDIESNQAGDGNTVTVRSSGTVSISAVNGVRLLSEGGTAVVPYGNGGDGGDLYLDYDPDSSVTSAWTVEVTGGSDPSYGFRVESRGGASNEGGDGGDIYAGASGSTYKVTSSSDGVNGASIASKGGTKTGGGSESTGNGGSIYVDGAWDIQLTGSDGVGMLVESIGGDNEDQKGTGGSGKAISFSDTFVGQISTNAAGASVVSNGIEGTNKGGDAGFVDIQGSWSVSTVGTGLNVESTGGDSSNADKGGVGGAITVDIENVSDSSNPMIKTTGANGHGINVLQSSGNNAPDSVSDATTVSMTISGDIDVSGAGAHGVQAASSGNTRGVIDISVASGVTIDGGAASTDGPDGSAISVIDGGALNTLTNEGTLTSASGVAVQYSGEGKLHVQNVSGGIINGSVPNQDGSGAITVQNDKGALIEAGERFDVETIENNGKFSPGGDGLLKVTKTSADFLHGSSGTILFDIFSIDSYDQIFVGQNFNLAEDSTIELNFLDLSNPAGLYGTYDFLFAEDILFSPNVAFPSTDFPVKGDFLNFEKPKGFLIDFAAEDHLGGGEVLRLTVSATPVPLPAGAVLLLTALGGLVLRVRRSKGNK